MNSQDKLFLIGITIGVILSFLFLTGGVCVI